MQRTRQQSAQQVEQKQSQALCKNMTKLSISAILKARGLLDDACFKSKPFVDGMTCDQLDCMEKDRAAHQSQTTPKIGSTDEETCSLQEGAFLQQWIECGVFDAIEKQYLKSMSLIVARGQEEIDDEYGPNVLENYTFKYDYSEDGECLINVEEGEESVPCTKAKLLEQAKQLIRNLSLFNESLSSLPEQRTLVLKLKYHPNTPEDYEPQYFRESNSEAYSKYISKQKKVSIGGISTAHHSMQLTFTAANWLFDEEDSDDDESEDEEEYHNDDADAVSTGGGGGGNSNWEDLSPPEMIDSNVVVLKGVEDIEDEPVTQEENNNKNMKPPSSTPVHTKSRWSNSKPNNPEARGQIGDDDELQTKFSEFSTQDKNGDDDDEVTRLDDDDDDVTRLDKDEEEEGIEDEDTTQSSQGSLNPEQEAAVLKIVRGRKSVSVSVIAMVTNIAEHVVTSILDNLQERSYVIKNANNRWLLTPEGQEASGSLVGSSMDEDSVSVEIEEKKPTTPFTRSKNREVKAPTRDSAMLPPPVVQRKRRAAEENWENSHMNNEEEEEAGSFCDFSQESVMSQGRSKYSIVERPLNQNKKKRTYYKTKNKN